MWWARLDLNQRPIGYAYHCNFRCLFRVCGLDCLFTLCRVPAVQSLHLPVANTLGLARDYHVSHEHLRLPRL